MKELDIIRIMEQISPNIESAQKSIRDFEKKEEERKLREWSTLAW